MSWEQYAPTSESQLARLSRLKAACGGEEAEAVVRRNQPAAPEPIQKLGDSAKPAGIATLYKQSCGRGVAAIEGGVYDGGGGGGGDELGESARERGAQLREYARTCQAFVSDIERAVYLLDTIAQQQEQVRVSYDMYVQSTGFTWQPQGTYMCGDTTHKPGRCMCVRVSETPGALALLPPLLCKPFFFSSEKDSTSDLELVWVEELVGVVGFVLFQSTAVHEV